MKRELPYQSGTRLLRLLGGTRGRSSAKLTQAKPSARVRVLWTLGNLFMLIGVVLLIYVGGIYVQADYDRYAARGDTDLPAPPAVSAPAEEEPAPFTAPVLNAGAGIASDGQVVGAVPDSTQAAKNPTVTRVTIP